MVLNNMCIIHTGVQADEIHDPFEVVSVGEDNMNIFHINKKLKSYFYPIIIIIVCLCLILVFIFRNQFIHVANKTNEIIGFVCMATGIVCIYCIYISCFEISQIHENLTKNKKKHFQVRQKNFL